MNNVRSFLGALLIVCIVAVLLMSIFPGGGGALGIALLVAFVIWIAGRS